jgi:hypothetical protein
MGMKNTKKELLKAIKKHCFNCIKRQTSTGDCDDLGCPFYPFRFED